MKQYLKIVGLVTVFMACHTVLPADAEFFLSTGIRYDQFSADRASENEGFEFTVPVGVAYRRQQFSVSLESAFSSAAAKPDNEDTVELSHVTDTLLSVLYTHNFPERPMGLLLALDVNIPTGKEQFTERERAAEAGQSNDLFEVDNFGDGVNVGLSLGLLREIGKVSLGVQGAYIFNGEYDPTLDTPDDDLDPGDQTLGMAMLGWQASQQMRLDAFASYSHFLPDKVNNQETFQEGPNVVLGGNLRYDRGPMGITISVQGTIQGKNKELVGNILQAESENSNGRNLFGLMHVTYRLSPKFMLRLLGDIRYYGESDRTEESSGLPYKGKRIRYAIGPGFMYSLNKHLSCDGLFKYFTMTQQPDITWDQEPAFQGVNLDMGVTYRF